MRVIFGFVLAMAFVSMSFAQTYNKKDPNLTNRDGGVAAPDAPAKKQSSQVPMSAPTAPEMAVGVPMDWDTGEDEEMDEVQTPSIKYIKADQRGPARFENRKTATHEIVVYCKMKADVKIRVSSMIKGKFKRRTIGGDRPLICRTVASVCPPALACAREDVNLNELIEKVKDGLNSNHRSR